MSPPFSKHCPETISLTSAIGEWNMITIDISFCTADKTIVNVDLMTMFSFAMLKKS